MYTVKLGRTEIVANGLGFGALPIQRTSKDVSAKILRQAYDAGVNFFDTARSYTDSQIKLGAALSGVRQDIYIASKVSGAQTAADVRAFIDESLQQLQTDYIDIMQFHNPDFVPIPDGEDGLYDAMMHAKEQGKIRYIGLTNHSYERALEAIKSGFYDTIQYPISYLSSEKELGLIAQGKKYNVGVLAMKPLAGGLLHQAEAVYYFFQTHKGCLPLYGIQHAHELEQFVQLAKHPPQGESVKQIIAQDQKELSENFCRGCGYCMPCPVDIQLSMVCRMSLMLKRAPVKEFVTQEWYDAMQQTKECTECGTCNTKCPYNFMPQMQLQEQYNDYMRVYEQFHSK